MRAMPYPQMFLNRHARPIRGVLPVFCLSMFWLLLPQPVFAADAPETIDPDASCVSSKCHTSMNEFKYLHWSDLKDPGECQSCHEQDEDEVHEFEVDDSMGKCFECHEDLGERIEAAKVVHEAVEDGCPDCHDPHGGETKFRLSGVKDDDLRRLCFDCHETEIFEEEVKHGPADAGACNECHDPHASPNKTLLLSTGVDLCGDCHEEIAEGMQDSKYTHEPAAEDCTECHDPHSSPHPLMLFAKKSELCNECHDDVVETARNSKVQHAPAIEKEECLTCHTPHSSNARPNLRKPQRELCLSCHNKGVETKSGERLQNIEGWLKANPELHKPIAEDECSGCHNPHGSDSFRILKEDFPPSFYSPFNIKNFALCFLCHERTLVTTRATTSLTNFRNGTQNLHFLHVNRKKKGRSCRACHEVHASKRPLHIRETVRFGRWEMPIDFERSTNGGSCSPGCHTEESYDRKSKE